jgi:tetratricopeptide (TPR) repeat protein
MSIHATAIGLMAVLLTTIGTALGEDRNSWERLSYEAVMASKRGETAEALRICQLAMEKAATFTPDDPRLPKTHMLMGEIHRRAQKPGAAEQCFVRAVSVCEHAVGGRHHHLLDPLEALGNFYFFSGRFADAAPVCRRIVEIAEQAPARTDREIAMRTVNLAEVLRLAGCPDEAAPLYERALSLSEKSADGDLDTFAGQLLLGAQFYRGWGKYERAEALALRTLKLRSGRTDRDALLAIATCRDTLGEIYAAWAKPGQAEAEYRHALAHIEEVFGPDSAELAPRWCGLATAMAAQGRGDDAVVALLKAIRVTENGLGLSAPELAPILEQYATALAGGGNSALAEAQRKRAEKIRMGASPQ